jgi:hypothetical protein
MPEIISDPLGNCISISDNAEDVVGDHPYKHGVSTDELVRTVADPNAIYGHSENSNRAVYFSRARNLFDGNNYNQAIIHYDGKACGHVVTCYRVLDMSGASVNADDIRYISYK